MKILHVGKYFSPFNGGLENYMRDAMVALARRDVESAALVHRNSFSLKTQVEEYVAEGHRFKLVRAAMWARLLFTPISPTFPWLLRNFIHEFKPDVLHLHLPNPSAFWALMLPAARRIPWVVHWHSDVITSAQGWLMKVFYKFYQPFEHAMLKRATAIVATSPAYLGSSKPLGEWSSKCHVVPLGVDVERFRATEVVTIDPGQDDSGLRVLAVGRLTYYKGFQTLIKAAAISSETRIHLVGSGEQAAELKSLVASLKLNNRVTLHGVLSDDQLARQMAECDCLCLPSIERTEAFGMVLLEAMYFAKATIVSDVPGSGMGWIVDDGITGLKVPPAEANLLADAFDRLLADRDQLTIMGQNGKQKFDQQFEINHAVEPLLEVYELTVN